AESRCWKDSFASLGSAQRDALAPMLFTIALRRACARGDLGRVQAALQTAITFRLDQTPSATQAAALLRRAQTLLTTSAGSGKKPQTL
ncbi:MAG: hypothetical protein M3Y30_07755, partial [Gemmatimonadota bacterium]|nr:hypothetical protein [Gemmatimonadota bacterium]